jgi:hypothetical protein
MADRFDEMARDLHELRLSPVTLAQWLRKLHRELAAAEREAGAADMREAVAVWHEEKAERVRRDYPDEFSGRIRFVESGHRVDAAAIRDLPTPTPKET